MDFESDVIAVSEAERGRIATFLDRGLEAADEWDNSAIDFALADAYAPAELSDVSAIVVTYYTGPLLARAIAALCAQPRIREIIIVDNGNWDGAVSDALAVVAQADPRIERLARVISGQGNVGFAVACNLGATAASGDYLLFVNPDAVLPDGAVDQLVADGEARARPWVIAPKLVDPDGCEQQGSRRTTLTPWRAFVEATKLYRFAPRHPYFRRFNLHADPCPRDVAPLPVISGACFLTPAEDYRRIGGMDERYFLHVEDVDFCLRFAKAGGAVYFDPHVSVTHYKSSSRCNPLRVEMRKTASILRYFRRHFSEPYPAAFLWLVACALWLAFAAKAATSFIACGVAGFGFRIRHGRDGVRRARELTGQRAAR